MERKPTLVVALGGNALLKRGEPLEADIQRQNIEQAARTIAGLTEQWRVVLVHGNGPQVGLLALQNSAYDKVTPTRWTFSVPKARDDRLHAPAGAEKQSPAARGQRPAHTGGSGRRRPGLQQPDQVHRPGLQRSQAKALAAEKGWVFKADGSYFRRVVPSPQPKRIVESDAITALIQRDHLVICNGGGGVPVVEHANGYRGIEAVIDKDLSAALLARQIEADALLILTDADAVYLDWGKPTQRPLAQVTPELLRDMQFDAGSMGPKVAACREFVEACGGIAGIGALADGAEIPRARKAR